jgi:hypothetical protein
METIYVTVHTVDNSGNSRNVTLLYSEREGHVVLLGGLNHGTVILVDQKLVDDLQALVNTKEQR